MNIIDARYLNPTDNTFVRVEQKGREGRTKTKQGTGPIWNEAVVFEIDDIDEDLHVQLVSEKTGEIWTEQIDLNDVKDNYT